MNHDSGCTPPPQLAPWWKRTGAWLWRHFWEVGLVVLGGVLCVALVFADGLILSDWSRLFSWAGWLGFLAGLLFLTGRAVWALWTRRWVGAAVRVLALPVCLLLGVASLLVGEMAGRWVGQATELVVGASPLPKKEVLAWQILGREAVAQLPAEESAEAGTDGHWKFEGLEFVWKRGGRWEVHFQFSRRGADFASVTLRFRQTDGGGWREEGYAGSGDPAPLQAVRAVLGSYLREALSSPEWPAQPLTQERLAFFREAGEELAAGFAEASPLDSDGLQWHLEEMGFAGNDATALGGRRGSGGSGVVRTGGPAGLPLRRPTACDHVRPLILQPAGYFFPR